MDDNKTKDAKNQSGPIFESVSFDDVPQTLQPEEIPPEAAAPAGPEEAFLNAPPPELTGELPPVYEESKTKYFIIGGAVLFFVIVFIGIIAFFLTRKPAQTVAENVTLQFWGLWEDKATYEPLIQEYQKKNPNVKIVYQKMDPKDYRVKLIARGRAGNGPDLFRFHNTWLPEIQEVAAPIPKELMSNADFEKTFYPFIHRDLKMGEDYYGIPLSIDGLVLIYNDALFKKAGITTPPTNWIGDLIDDVGKLTVQDGTGVVTSGIAMGTASNVDHFAEIYGILLLQNGGTLSKLDSKEAAEAMEVYREFAEKDIWNDKMPNNIVAFAQQKVAMIIAPSWQVLAVKAINPELEVKVAQVPRGLDGKPLSLATYWVEGVSKFSKHQVEAWKFLVFLAQKENQQKMYEQQSKVRPFGSASSRVDMKDLMLQNEYLAPVIQQTDSYQSMPVAFRTFDAGMNDENITYLQNAVNETARGVSYEEALKTAQQGVSTVLNRYKVPTPAAAQP